MIRHGVTIKKITKATAVVKGHEMPRDDVIVSHDIIYSCIRLRMYHNMHANASPSLSTEQHSTAHVPASTSQ